MNRKTIVEFVHRIAEHTADKPEVRSALRSGLGKHLDQCDHMHQHLRRWIIPDRSGATDHEQRCLYTIASLIAHTPEGAVPQSWPGNLGSTMALATQRGVLARTTSARAVERLGKQPTETVCRHLVNVVVPLRSNRVPVDFTTLLEDLLAWPRRQSQIRRNWLQSFYVGVDVGTDE